MGIRISEMEEATTFGADDYVPIVTNGTNKKALGQKIKDFIAGFFVSKSGDTMTGDLNINSNNARTKYINPNMTLDTSANNGLSSDSSYGAYFTDKNGNAVGDVSMTTRSTGRNYAQLMARNKKTDGTSVANYIDVIADKDGSTSYYVSDPASFRAALGLKELKVESLVLNTMITTTSDSTVNTYSSRKISNYDILIFHQIYENGDIRNTATIPVSVWKSGYSINMMALHGASSSNASDYRASGLVLSFNSDAAFSARYFGSGGIRTIAIYGVKLV